MAEGSFANDGDMVAEESIDIRNRVVVEEGIHNQNKQCLYICLYMYSPSTKAEV